MNRAAHPTNRRLGSFYPNRCFRPMAFGHGRGPGHLRSNNPRIVEIRTLPIGVINRERRCAAFTPYRPEYSPREHDEMLASASAHQADDRRAREWQVCAAEIS